MKLSLDALLVLDAIDRRGSFSAASDELHRVPSAITYAVQKLEQDLDVQLFDRSGHRAVLTPAGAELLEQGRHLLEAAGAIEARVRRVATGWEAELAIAYDDIFPIDRLLPIVEEFYRIGCGTPLRITAEVLGGCWDALAHGRADLALGVSGSGPATGGYSTRLMGTLPFAFAVAPGHPLAKLPEPLQPTDIVKHRAVVVADSSRNLPPRSSGLLSGQDTLTVPTLAAKVEAQHRGLGVGYLPESLAHREASAGRLVIKKVAEPKPEAALYMAWRSAHKGKALAWFLERLDQPGVLQSFLL